jgi:hypothetical protein
MMTSLKKKMNLKSCWTMTNGSMMKTNLMKRMNWSYCAMKKRTKMTNYWTMKSWKMRKSCCWKKNGC